VRLTARGFGDIAPGRKKGWLNFLYVAGALGSHARVDNSPFH
jgi:hypothetical protein